MYAKLVFNASTVAGIKVRDITRLIVESNSGSASLSNLEGIDVSSSELVAGTNSGWSLASGYSIPTSGTTVSATDSEFHLTAPCATSSKTKYATIQTNGSWTSANIYNSTVPSVCVGTTTRVGESDEQDLIGYSGTTATTADNFFVGSSTYSTTVHVFATPYKLILAGYNASGINGWHGVVEFAENHTTTNRNIPPFFWTGNPGAYGSDTEAFATRATTTGYDEAGGGNRIIWPNTFVNNGNGQQPRIYEQWNDNNVHNNGYDEVTYMTNGSNVPGTLITDPQSLVIYDHSDSFDEPASIFSRSGSRTDLQTTSTGMSGDTHRLYDGTTGDRVKLVRPIVHNFRFGNYGILDFTNAGLYKCSGQLGTFSDNLSIGSDDYFFYPFDVATSRQGLLIKKD